MGRRKGSGEKPKKRKKVTVRIIKEKHAGEITEPHRLLTEIRKQFHAHLEAAKIGLAWRMGWKSDTDGHMTMGQCRKSSDLDREMYAGFDFVILLNEEAWPTLNDSHKRALIDHELCHAAITMDADGNPKYNDRDRLCCRVKKHDIDEFKCIVERHGLYTQDLEDIAKAAINDAKRPLLGESEKGEKVNGADVVQTGPSDVALPADWRKWPIDELGEFGLPIGKVKILAAEFSNLGKLMDSLAKAEEPGFWYKAVKGLGEAGYDALTEAIAKMRAARPTFQAETVEPQAAGNW